MGQKNKQSDNPVPVNHISSRPKQPPKRKDAAIEIIDDTGNKEEKERASNIPWANNPGWIGKAIEYLTDNPQFRLKLFSDSTEDAMKEGRKKHQGKESKIIMHGTLADAVFVKDTVPEEMVQGYETDKTRYVKSLQQQFAQCVTTHFYNQALTNLIPKLKKQYSVHVKSLYQTGGGLKAQDQQDNLIEKIKDSFPYWDELDGFWRELPNYNPIGGSNSTGGVDHGARAESLFAKKSAEGESGDASGIEDSPSWKAFENVSSSRRRSTSSVGNDMDLVDELQSDEEKPVAKAEKKGKDTTCTKTAKTPAKPGEKRTFDLSSLDEAHCKDMADSARRQDSRIDLEVKRTELQLKHERNKKRKLDFDAERLQMDHEDRREWMQREEERNNCFFSFMSGMMGVGTGMSMGSPVACKDR